MAQKIDYIDSVGIIAEGGVLGLPEGYGALKWAILGHYALQVVAPFGKVGGYLGLRGVFGVTYC